MREMFFAGRVRMQMVFIILLGICAIYDLRSKTIPAMWIWGILGFTIVYRLTIIISGQGTIMDSLLCLIPGVFLLIISRCGKLVGSGDGWLIIAEGLFWEWTLLICILVYSFLAAGLFSIGYLIMGRRDRKETIPFVPFLFVGMLIFVIGDLM